MTRLYADLIDRDPQNLPVPLGGMAPVRVQRARRRPAVRRHLPAALFVAGLAFGAAGLTLLLSQPRAAVYLLGDRLHVGGMVLTRVGPLGGSQLLRYQGEASYVLAERGDGTATAASAWTSAGVTSSGVCRMRPDGVRFIEDCFFSGGRVKLTSVDVLDTSTGSGWQRTYDDGNRVAIAVLPDGAAVPVPFPIGR